MQGLNEALVFARGQEVDANIHHIETSTVENGDTRPTSDVCFAQNMEESMTDQKKLSGVFTTAEKHRLHGANPVEGWGSNVDQDNDYLWDVTTDTHWGRKRPDGEWYVIPALGSDTA